LLRAGRKRPRGCYSGNYFDEITPPHGQLLFAELSQ